MPKTIVLLLDGTSNQISEQRTNILRLYGCLKRDETQLVYYDPGVGTLGDLNAVFRAGNVLRELWGQLTGYGLDRNVLEAYRFLQANYRTYESEDPAARNPETGRDRIVIAGFSRGAYTARVLAGFIHAVGLLDDSQMNLLDYAYRAYKRIGAQKGEEPTGRAEHTAFAEVRLFERILQPDRPPIHALLLFDTVASVLERGPVWWRWRSHAFTRNNTSVRAVRHALAIHERRVMFRPALWPEDQVFRRNRFDARTEAPQDVREVWFRGVHGDVGGGQRERESGLAKVALAWIIGEAEELGLVFKKATVNRIVLGRHENTLYVAPDPERRPADSMSLLWRIVEFIPAPARHGYGRRFLSALGWHLPLFQPRVIPEGARVHGSVFDAAEARGEALPENLPQDRRLEG